MNAIEHKGKERHKQCLHLMIPMSYVTPSSQSLTETILLPGVIS